MEPKDNEEGSVDIKKVRRLMSKLYSVILWLQERNELPDSWLDYAHKNVMLLVKELKIDPENAKLLKKKNGRWK